MVSIKIFPKLLYIFLVVLKVYDENFQELVGRSGLVGLSGVRTVVESVFEVCVNVDGLWIRGLVTIGVIFLAFFIRLGSIKFFK